MTAERRAEVTWEGDLFEGAGRVALASGVATELPVTWASRTEEPDASEFEKHAEAAKEGCPVSNALKGNVDIRVKASFV